MSAIRLILAVFIVLAATLARAEELPQFPKPGPEHELLRQLAGEWDAAMKCNFEPGKPPIESTGTYTGKMEVGGFFLITEYKGEFAGQPFQGRGTSGYDSFQKKYKGTWVDSMSPAIYHTEGSFDKAGKVFSERMEGPGPDGKPMKMRMTTEIKDADHMVFTMYNIDKDGKETQAMEIAYTRKK
jgi:hypothetical protein